MRLFSAKVLYGVSAVYEIYKKGNSLISIGDIATNTNIPKNYLEHILNDLRRAGIIKSTKGANGGYTLNKDSNEIFIKDIVAILEGDVFASKGNIANHIIASLCKDIKIKVENILTISIKDINMYDNSNVLHFHI